MRKILKISLILVFMLNHSVLLSQPTRIMNSAELELALRKLNVLGSVLMVAAHPDDENTALLSYLSSGRLVRTAYLSTTRGGGGQNLIGTEKGALMSVIRTQELVAARKLDGAEQFFTRAIDFGYSKSSEEAIRIWGRDEVVSDMVWIIRSFRPDVIITRFTAEMGGHGHHRASAILAQEAFHAANDPNQYSEQLKLVSPWQPKRIIWNAWRRNRTGSDTNTSDLISVDVGEYNAFLGKSYTEIAAESRSMHKSQGFGSRGRRGQSINSFAHTAGTPAENDLFDGVDLTWNRVEGGKEIGTMITEAIASFQHDDPTATIPSLVKVYKKILTLPQSYWVNQKQKELKEIIRSSLGLWTEAIAEKYSYTPGSEANLTVNVINRSHYPVLLEKITTPYQTEELVNSQNLSYNQPFQQKLSVTIPEDFELTHPYWLRSKSSLGLFNVKDQKLIGQPENLPAMEVQFVVQIDGQSFIFESPVLYRWTDRVNGEQYRTLEIIPEVALILEENLYVFGNDDSRKIGLRVKAGKDAVSGQLQLQTPSGWRVEPSSQSFSLEKKDDERLFYFTLRPPEISSSGILTAEATVDGKRLSNGFLRIQYPHISIQTLFPPAEAKLVRLDLAKREEHIAYIMGSGDEVPKYLEQLGYHVDLLSDDDLENADLKRYDTIIAGVRVFNTRTRLKQHYSRVLDFVYKGGVLIIQYNTSRGLVVDNLGPFPFQISRDRVSVENAPIKFEIPDHPLLNTPNKITQSDFDGWVQERGLYFANQWDSNFQAPISSHDPGEGDKLGGIIYTEYGSGIFIYTGLSFFRELPAGVPGAYRLFVNMISAGKENGRGTH